MLREDLKHTPYIEKWREMLMPNPESSIWDRFEDAEFDWKKEK